MVSKLIHREKIKTARVKVSNGMARQSRFETGISKKDPAVDSVISHANQILSEEIQDDTKLIDSHRQVRTKFLMVTDSPRSGGGMLGGLAHGKGHEDSLHGTAGAAYANRIKTRLRTGRSGRVYVDRVREGDDLRFEPDFVNFDNSNEFDEIYEISKCLRQSVFQLSSDSLPSIQQISESEDYLSREIQWFVESFNSYRLMEERIQEGTPLASNEIK
jgi:hypothetical protein